MLEIRLLLLRLGKRERAVADLGVELVLDLVDLRRARVRLRPEVARVGGIAAELEADQVILLVRGIRRPRSGNGLGTPRRLRWQRRGNAQAEACSAARIRS